MCLRDGIHGSELQCCQMIRLARIGEPFGGAVPSGGGHGDPEVVKDRTAAQRQFPARVIGSRASAGRDRPTAAASRLRQPTARAGCYAAKAPDIASITASRMTSESGAFTVMSVTPIRL